MVYHKWKILWSKKAKDDLLKIEKRDTVRILDKVENQLAQNPISSGKKLTGKYQDYYRYRVGVYRILYALNQKEIQILILKVGKREGFYQ